jgi:hypothetical protein
MGRRCEARSVKSLEREAQKLHLLKKSVERDAVVPPNVKERFLAVLEAYTLEFQDFLYAKMRELQAMNLLPSMEGSANALEGGGPRFSVCANPPFVYGACTASCTASSTSEVATLPPPPNVPRTVEFNDDSVTDFTEDLDSEDPLNEGLEGWSLSPTASTAKPTKASSKRRDSALPADRTRSGRTDDLRAGRKSDGEHTE